MAKGPQQVEAMLTDLANEKEKAEALRLSLEDDKAEAKAMQEKLETDLARLREQEKRLLEETRDRVIEEAAGLQRQIRDAETELRKSKSRETAERARKLITDIHQQLEKDSWQTTKETTKGDGRFTIGDKVRLTNTNLDGVITRILSNGREVEVEAGQTRVTLGIRGVEKITPDTYNPPPLVSVRPSFTGRAVSVELDLRGKRADDVYPLLDSYLNEAFLANLAQVRVIHGFATGAIRSVVREIVSKHPLVKSFRPGNREEGGDGVTVVSL
jgi:DNA mismatch repair protein MutS2